jgi:hypothetical protein
MSVEPKRPQSSLMAFFGYMTLACMSFALVRRAMVVVELYAAPDVLLFLSAVMFAAAGASLGSLFGRPGAGAAVGFVAGVIAFWNFASWVIVIET